MYKQITRLVDHMYTCFTNLIKTDRNFGTIRKSRNDVVPGVSLSTIWATRKAFAHVQVNQRVDSPYSERT